MFTMGGREGKGSVFGLEIYFGISGCIIVIIGEFTYSTVLNGSTVPLPRREEEGEGGGGGERQINRREEREQANILLL